MNTFNVVSTEQRARAARVLGYGLALLVAVVLLSACGDDAPEAQISGAAAGGSSSATSEGQPSPGADTSDSAPVTDEPTATTDQPDDSSESSNPLDILDDLSDLDDFSDLDDLGDLGVPGLPGGPLAGVDIEPVVVELPNVPAIVLPDLSELDELGANIESGLGEYLGDGLDVVSVACAADGAELTYQSTGDGFLSVNTDGSGSYSSNEGGRAVDITVGSDGSGTYNSSGDVLIDVAVGSDGSGTYYRSSGGNSVSLAVSASGAGTYEESGDAVITITLDGNGTGTYERVDPGSDGGVLNIAVTASGTGSYSDSRGGFIEDLAVESDGAFAWSKQGGDPHTMTSLTVLADGSGTYSDDASGVTIVVLPNGTGTYVSSDQTIAFTDAEGILDPALISIGAVPEFVAADQFPNLDTLPPLEPPCATVVRIDASVLFDFDSAELRPEAGPVLDDLVDALEEAGRTIEVGGHTDSVGTDAYNLDLSQRRANTVNQALQDRGLSVDSTAVGYGEARPVAPNETAGGADNPAGRQQNRRVEIAIR